MGEIDSPEIQEEDLDLKTEVRDHKMLQNFNRPEKITRFDEEILKNFTLCSTKSKRVTDSQITIYTLVGAALANAVKFNEFHLLSVNPFVIDWLCIGRRSVRAKELSNKQILKKRGDANIWEFDKGLKKEDVVYLDNIHINPDNLPYMEHIRRGFYSVLDENWEMSRTLLQELKKNSARYEQNLAEDVELIEKLMYEYKNPYGNQQRYYELIKDGPKPYDIEMLPVPHLLKYQTWKEHFTNGIMALKNTSDENK